VDPTRGLSATAQAFCDARATKLKLSGYVTALDSYESYSTNGQHRFACYVTTDPQS
jgi:hypothetical protein